MVRCPITPGCQNNFLTGSVSRSHRPSWKYRSVGTEHAGLTIRSWKIVRREEGLRRPIRTAWFCEGLAVGFLPQTHAHHTISYVSGGGRDNSSTHHHNRLCSELFSMAAKDLELTIIHSSEISLTEAADSAHFSPAFLTNRHKLTIPRQGCKTIKFDPADPVYWRLAESICHAVLDHRAANLIMQGVWRELLESCVSFTYGADNLAEAKLVDYLQAGLDTLRSRKPDFK
jgi:hypothetical protein